MTSVQFSVRFWKKTAVFGFTKLTSVSVFGSVFWTVCCLMCMTLEMMYFHAELVQLTVNRSDSELEVHRHGMKKNTLTVDPIPLQDELWMRQREKPSPNCWSRFFENRTVETEFSVFEFWGRFSSVFRKPISEIFIGFRTPLIRYDTEFALENWEDRTCQFSLAHKN